MEYVVTKKGRTIGKVVVQGSEVKIYNVRTKLKSWVAWTLLALGIFVAIVMVVEASLSLGNWFHECDEALGYTADYYSCRQYHIHK